MIISRRRVGLVEIEKIKDGGENDVRFLWIECVIRGGGGGGGRDSCCFFESSFFFDLEAWSFNYKSHLCTVKCTWKPVIITMVFRNIYYYCTLLYLSRWIISRVRKGFKRKYLHMLNISIVDHVIFIWIISFLRFQRYFIYKFYGPSKFK